jgi:hypothetical protein
MQRPSRQESRCGLRSSWPTMSTSSSSERSVHFGTVEVMKFPVIRVDHPCCSRGPALELSWKPETRKAHSVGLDEYESLRRPTRRNPHELRLSSSHRQKRLGIKKQQQRSGGKQPKRSELEKRMDSLDHMIQSLDIKLKDMKGCARKQVAAKSA